MRILVFILFLGVTACSTNISDLPTSAPKPETGIIEVAYPESLNPIQPALTQCAFQEPPISLIRNWENKAMKRNSLIIQLGEAPGLSNYVIGLGTETMVFIASPLNPTNHLSYDQVSNIFQGQMTEWPGTSLPIDIWLPGDKNKLAVIQNEFLREKPVSPKAYIASSPEEMKQGVRDSPGALGFLPFSWLDKNVKTIKIPDSLSNLLHIPILAYTNTNLSPRLKLFLECLQTGEGQMFIQQHYSPIGNN